jgi:hypothetical protein
MTLKQQIELIRSNLILSNFIDDKIEETIDLYKMENLDKFYSILKFKSIDIHFNTDKIFGSIK